LSTKAEKGNKTVDGVSQLPFQHRISQVTYVALGNDSEWGELRLPENKSFIE
jgi:hypothetical protein